MLYQPIFGHQIQRCLTFGVFVHYVNQRLEFVSRFLELRYLDNNHTDFYLQDQLKQVVAEWGIEDKVI